MNQPVTATSFNLIKTTSSGTFTCEKVTLHYVVAVNGPNHVVLNPISAHNATAENCHLQAGPFKFTNHITNFGFGQLTINTWGTGSAAATFTSNITGTGLLCTFHGNIPFQATNGIDVVHIETGNTLTGTGTNCPATAETHGSFTLESNGVAVTTHFVSTG